MLNKSKIRDIQSEPSAFFSYDRRPVIKTDFIINNVQKGDRIRKNNENNEKRELPFAEKITVAKFIIFLIYFFSLLTALEIHTSFLFNQMTTTVLYETFLNQIVTIDGTIEIQNNQYISFDEITTFDNITKWMTDGILEPIYGGAEMFSHFDPNNPLPASYVIITPIRLLQQRTLILNTSNNPLFPSIWNLNGLTSNTTAYGSKYTEFLYNPSENGFNVTLPVLYISQSEAQTSLNNIVDNGFFDMQTTTLKVDFAVFSGMTNLISYFKAYFTFSPSGRIDFKDVNFTNFRIDLYHEFVGKVLAGSQIVFALLSIYYFFQEFIKVNDQIKSASRTNSQLKGHNILERGAEEIRNRLKNILTGIFNHVSDPWCLLDVISLGCSIYTIHVWAKVIILNEPTRSLAALELKEGRLTYDQLTKEKEDIIYGLNQTVESLCDIISNNYIISAINCIILIAKGVKYLGRFNHKMRDFINVSSNIVGRLVPFIILLYVVLSSFVFVVYFEFGGKLSEFRDYFSSLRYFVINLHYSFSQVENMFEIDFGFTMVFLLLFIFIVKLILASQFVLYVTHEYMNYFKRKAKEERSCTETKSYDKFNFSPHPLWKITQFFKKKIWLQICKVISKNRYNALIKVEQQEPQEKERSVYQNFDFDVDIKNIHKSNMDTTYYSEKTLNKIRGKEKVKLVKEIWRMIGFWILVIFCMLISLEHQKPSQERSVVHSIEAVIQKRSVNDEPLFPIKLDNFRELENIDQWLQNLFADFAIESNVTVNGKTLRKGYYFRGNNLLITNKYRMSLRKSVTLPNTLEIYNTVSSEIYTDQFAADAPLMVGELTIPLTTSRGNVYNYTANNGFANAGGYIFSVDIQDFQTFINTIVQEGFISSFFNSVVLDFAVYQPDVQSCVYVSIVFTVDNAINAETTIDINFMSLDYYQTPYQFFIAFSECMMSIGLIIRVISLIRKTNWKKQHYDTWLTLKLSSFPPIMKVYREKKRPEFLRKYSYVFEFEELSDFAVIIIGAACIALWVVYILIVIKIKTSVNKFLATAVFIDNETYISQLILARSILNPLKYIEPLLIIVLTMKVIYSYSNFNMFTFLTTTLKKTVKEIPFMAILFIITLVAFALFLHISKGTTTPHLNNLGVAFTFIIHNLSKFRDKLRPIITSEAEVAMTLIFYFPFVLFVYFICTNIFLAVMSSAYRSAKLELKEKTSQNLTFGEFFRISFDLFVQHFKKKEAVIEANFRQTVKYNKTKVFIQLEDAAETAHLVNDPDLWASTCAKNLLDEHNARKSAKSLAKILAKMHLNNLENNLKESKENGYKSKLSRHKATMNYWMYLKTGQENMLNFMFLFKEMSRDVEKSIKDLYDKEEETNDMKIKKYILQLETQVQKNLFDIQQMKGMVGEYIDVSRTIS